MLIDTHAHLMFDDFAEDLETVVERAQAAGVDKIVNIACEPESAARGLELIRRFDGMYLTLGFHPYDSDRVSDEILDEWRELAVKESRIVGIGECGLDYFKCKIDPEVQKHAFRKQLLLAKDLQLPVVIHNREADVDCLDILYEFVEEGQLTVDVVFHCFGSDLDFAKKVWSIGAYTSFTGIVTYPNAEGLRDVVAAAPLDQFMIETDCPYLAPQSRRGKRNEPAFVSEVAEKIAEVRGIDLLEIARISTENAERFFKRLSQ